MPERHHVLHVITGLTNGQAYTFTVTATNSGNETSPQSSPSNSVTVTAGGYGPVAGTWNLGATMSGPVAPASQSCTLTMNQDGTFESNCSLNDGANQASSGNAWVFPDGIRFTIAGSSSLSDWLCQTNPAATVLACTATVNTVAGAAYLSQQNRAPPIRWLLI
ncbi:MAG: fibronectin type III domain-containing protein [Syntrophobacteraceae bacterium]